ncbi:Putative thiolase, polyketide synthase, beta-ketoacyl synthase domain-containing protein [Colletotrichum destructivum]|uniref:Thiolase, polyketide synthase, beta-ketoacyl synthase domain-containing protein n=1 Tax=Colletotrichum destructivum TaxID=34406 RepID=A0AAX4J404_9PEZI|nr:Putative thiolase, polyketide synthase, beta-ketoacyl synthase domain-containing protein [Colletotrichum destructivum]
MLWPRLDTEYTIFAVYVGVMTHDFELVKVKDTSYSLTYFAMGAATSIASHRLLYFFDWHGPSLRSGSSKTAITADSNSILSLMSHITESKLNMLSPTGRFRIWDTAADGYARGVNLVPLIHCLLYMTYEATLPQRSNHNIDSTIELSLTKYAMFCQQESVVTVVLKTLSQALLDDDSIGCVIRETGINQDGRTQPHVALEVLIRETHARAGVDVAQAEDRCQFFEAHGRYQARAWNWNVYLPWTHRNWMAGR